MKLQRTPSKQIKDTRIRVPNYLKMGVSARSYVKFRLNLLQDEYPCLDLSIPNDTCVFSYGRSGLVWPQIHYEPVCFL